MRFPSILASALLLAAPVLADDGKALITVTGEGQVAVVPDMATISLGVTVNGETAKAALDANSAALAAVLERLTATGIEAKDIQTSGLSLGPVYDYSSSGGAQLVQGYTASNMVTVRVRAIDRVGPVLDASVTDGANTLNGITFGLLDPLPATDDARRKAVEDARRKADLYAGAAGVELGSIVSITEGGGYGMPMMMGAAPFAKADSVPVAAGELSVGASVTVTFAVAD
jgi:uncharacterized protein YggE